MKVRVNMYIEEEDKKIIRFIREKYNLDSDAMAVRFLLRKYAKSEGYKPDKTKGKE
jgi:sulfur relay (sulfurtransferase) DsrC/TusE family protein